MEKRDLSEEDIRAQYITPAIEKAGWDIKKQVRFEYPSLLRGVCSLFSTNI